MDISVQNFQVSSQVLLFITDLSWFDVFLYKRDRQTNKHMNISHENNDPDGPDGRVYLVQLHLFLLPFDLELFIFRSFARIMRATLYNIWHVTYSNRLLAHTSNIQGNRKMEDSQVPKIWFVQNPVQREGERDKGIERKREILREVNLEKYDTYTHIIMM